MADRFTTLAAECRATTQVPGSRFLAIARPVVGRDDAEAFVARERRAHVNPTHVVPAFRLRDGTAFASDAGEPTGSAGSPLLAVLRGRDLLDVACVVIRWYGGVNLGVGGLQRAYARALDAALADAVIVAYREGRQVSVRYGHELTAGVHRALEAVGARDLAHRYADAVTTEAAVVGDRVDELARRLADLTDGRAALRVDDAPVVIRDAG